MMLNRLVWGALLSTSLGLAGCAEVEPTIGTTGPGGGKADGYDDFLAEAYCEPDSQVCIIEGDIPVIGEAGLRAYFEARHSTGGALTVFREDEVDLLWNSQDRFDLTYCVSSTEFTPEEHRRLVADMAAAAAEWEQVAHVDYRYVPAEDARCTVDNRRVRFPVIAAPLDAPYIARAFFPYYPELEQAVRVSFAQTDALTARYPEASLQGILRHELGHTLGFRHEHIRPENAGGYCYENDSFRPITEYDRRSTMHYPHCDGEGDWSLQLTELDAIGAAFFYPDWERYRGDRCPGAELDAAGHVSTACPPVVHELLELANTGSFHTLDTLVGLDVRAASAIVERRSFTPHNQLETLEAVPYVGPVALRKMYDYLYVDGRCEVETDLDGLIATRCRPIVHRLLELANTATRETLDVAVSLDSRAAVNIVEVRATRPFTSLVDLWAVPYVKTTALKKMYGYLY